ncbi:MAG: RibD family protein, partial [Burkholderiales bacterium]
VETLRQPIRVVVDSRFGIAESARILQGGGKVLVFCASEPKRPVSGAEPIVLPNPAGKVDLPAMLAELARRGVNELHVEAGFRLNGSLVREGCVDEFLVYLNPSFLGDAAQGVLDLPPFDSLEQRPRLALRSVERIGDDLRILARPL